MFIEDVKLFFGDYIFKFINKYLVTLFIIVINILFHVILIRNNSKYSILLSRKLQLNLLINLEIDGYYYLNSFEKI